MSKNDLSAFHRKPTSKKILTDTSLSSTKFGASKKPAQEKLSQRVQTMLTQSEFEKLERERGAIPMSAFLRMKLKDIELI